MNLTQNQSCLIALPRPTRWALCEAERGGALSNWRANMRRWRAPPRCCGKAAGRLFQKCRSRCSPMQRYGRVSTTCCRLKKPMLVPAQQRELATTKSPTRALAWWRGLAVAGSLATVAAVSVGLWLTGTAQQQMSSLQAQLQTTQAALQAAPQIQYVAVLADGKADASMLVTFDPRNNQLVPPRVGGFAEPSNQSLQLWALPPQGAPRSLGVMGHGKLDQFEAHESDVKAVPALAISLEPKGVCPVKQGLQARYCSRVL